MTNHQEISRRPRVPHGPEGDQKLEIRSQLLPATGQARAVREVIERLQSAGYEAYLAGGGIRDLLLERTPKDYDVVTSAPPEEVEKLFAKTIPVGRQFGILVILQGRYQFEVATFRTEGGYADRRRPDQVTWASAEEDAQRRDFTVNALFYDPVTARVLDFVAGERDLAARLIRFVGDPDQRVREDPLRILRAIRLKNSLSFQYDPATYRAVMRHAQELRAISAERIRDELNLMWADPRRADALHELAEVGLLKEILPEIEALRGVPQPYKFHREGDVFAHTVRALAALPKQSPTFLVWAVLMHDAGKAQTLQYPSSPVDRIRFEGHRTVGAWLTRQVGVRLKFPKIEIETIAWLVEHHMNLKGLERMREAKRRSFLLDPRFLWLLELHRADAAGTTPRDLSLYRNVKAFYARHLVAWRAEQKAGAPPPLLTGHDLMSELGLAPGPKLGRILAKLKEAQLERKITTRSEAIRLATQVISQRS